MSSTSSPFSRRWSPLRNAHSSLLALTNNALPVVGYGLLYRGFASLCFSLLVVTCSSLSPTSFNNAVKYFVLFYTHSSWPFTLLRVLTSKYFFSWLLSCIHVSFPLFYHRSIPNGRYISSLFTATCSILLVGSLYVRDSGPIPDTSRSLRPKNKTQENIHTIM